MNNDTYFIVGIVILALTILWLGFRMEDLEDRIADLENDGN